MRYPDVSIKVVPADELPSWVPRQGFSGLVQKGQVARSVAVTERQGPRHAVIVDLPVQSTLDDGALGRAGIRLGEPPGRSLFNTATFLTHVDWETGAVGQTTVAMSVDIGMLYDWLTGAQVRQSSMAGTDGIEAAQRTVSFSQIALYMFVGVGALLFVIEIVALGNGLALARTITSSVDQLFNGTERVKSGDFRARIAVGSNDQLGQLAASFNEMTGRIEDLLREQGEKRRLEEELRIARDIQMSLLPEGILKVPGVSVAALCSPAREVGGDYYDYLPRLMAAWGCS